MFNVSQYLKEKRMEKGFSANKVAKVIGVSQGHLSGIENGRKNIPNEKFIEKYLQVISSNSKEYNAHVYLINKKSMGKYKLGHNVTTDSMISAFSDEEVADRHTFHNKEGDLVERGFEFPINDLNYHLSNEHNAVFYKNEKLTDNQVSDIEKLIKEYLVNSYEVRENTLRDLNKEGLIDDKILDEEVKTITRKIKRIKY